MRVLVVKTSSLGDIIHTLPALTDAGKVFPNIVFDWVVEEGFAEIPSWHPLVDRVIPVAIRRWRKNIVKTLLSREWKVARIELSRYHYDLVIDAQGLMKSAWITWIAKGTSYGLDRQSVREPLASLLYKHVVNVPKEQHAVERIRQLFAEALDYPCPTTTADYGLTRREFSHSHSGEDSVVFLHGTTRDDKHWPEPYWRELAERLCAAGFAVKLPWGNDVERQRAERISQGLDLAGVLPRLNLESLATVISNARAVISVDTGLGHLTAALGVPNISLYGPTRPELIGAYGSYQLHLRVDELQQSAPGHQGSAAGESVSRAGIEPKIFAALTPDIVWQALNEQIMPIQQQGSLP